MDVCIDGRMDGRVGDEALKGANHKRHSQPIRLATSVNLFMQTPKPSSHYRQANNYHIRVSTAALYKAEVKKRPVP